MTSLLDQIIEHKRREIVPLQSRRAEVRAQAAKAGRPRASFREALEGRDALSVIAEIKRASPSEGVLLGARDPLALLRAYEQGGASAISVVTDERFFQGSLDLLAQVTSATALPVLRKEFVVDSVQIEEARVAGAAAVLLLASVLSEVELRSFRAVAEGLGMDALVEVRDATELEKALRSGATFIGVNNRDLSTFRIDVETTFRLAQRLPASVVLVSESGVRDGVDFGRLQGVADAVLIGTSLVRAKDPEGLLKCFLRPARPVVKVCGVREVDTLRACEEAGVELVGFNFCPSSPRRLEVGDAVRLSREGGRLRRVGVFQNPSLEMLHSVLREVPLDFIQLHGQESAEFCAQVELPVIKSFFPHERVFPGVMPLFDRPKEDVESASPLDLQGFHAPSGPYFIAGGLTPSNVRSVLGRLRPFGVDVAGGVESVKGVKDVQKIYSFIDQLFYE